MVSRSVPLMKVGRPLGWVWNQPITSRAFPVSLAMRCMASYPIFQSSAVAFQNPGSPLAVYSGNTDFTINAADADYSSMEIYAADMVFTKAGVYKPKVNITVNGELLKKADYEVTYPNGGKMDAPGYMTIGIKLKGKNYTTPFDYISVTARIVSGKTDISKAKPVVLMGGKAVKSVAWKTDPGAEAGIMIKGKLISGDEFNSNFIVTVADCAVPGKATLIIRARSTSDYAGMCVGTIKVTKAELGVE